MVRHVGATPVKLDMQFLSINKPMKQTFSGRLMIWTICSFVWAFTWAIQVLCTIRPVFAITINRISAFSSMIMYGVEMWYT